MNEEQNQNLINITFTDVMQIIASKDTNPEAKIVYIYLLNVIMDLDEKIRKIESNNIQLPTDINVGDFKL